jgi:hypothetical protein
MAATPTGRRHAIAQEDFVVDVVILTGDARLA